MPEFFQSVEIPFFTNLLLLLVFAKVLGEIFERFNQPAMIGEILAGIILGPSLLNVIHRTDEIKTISEIGVFLLVIIAGLEINIEDIVKSIRGRNIIITITGFAIPFFSGLGVGILFDLDTMTTIFTGLCVAITALPVSIRILMDIGKIHTEIGQKIISVAIFDDIIAFAILGVLLHIKDTDMSFISVSREISLSILKLIFFLIVMFLIYRAFSKLSKQGNMLELKLSNLLSKLKGKESLYALFFVFILIFATITEALGFHFIIGSFFAAMLLNEELVGKQHMDLFHNATRSIAMSFLAPIFFAGIGLEFDIHSIQNITLLTMVLAVSFLSKIAGGFAGGKFAGLSDRISLTIGIGLNARGIMELVIANIAYKAGLISTEIFSILVIMGIVTTLSTPFMLKKCFSIFEKGGNKMK